MPKLSAPVRPEAINVKPIQWEREGVACLNSQSYKNFEWLLLEFERFKSQATSRMDYYDGSLEQK